MRLSSPVRLARVSARRAPRALSSLPLAAPAPAAAAATPRTDLSGYLARCRECNTPGARDGLLPLLAAASSSSPLGFVQPVFAEQLLRFPAAFLRDDASGGLVLNPALETEAQRTAAVAAATSQLRDDGVITGWRGELLAVSPSFHSPPSFLLERAAAPLFGVKAYGVHVNVFTRDPATRRLRVWVATRAGGKASWPNMLDHAVAGGQPAGISPADNVVKEAGEEAGVPEDLARTAVPVGAVSYEVVTPDGRGLKRDVLFCYDLELPADFVPVPVDGEVEMFELWQSEALCDVVRDTKRVKPNCNLVMIDWMVRHGLVTPESRGYLELLAALRTGELS